MATPLKTWQHSEPKRLWPILGGLSVLTHIGLLGLSLPYVLELMQASSTSATTIPIELVVVAPTDEPPLAESEPLQQTSPPAEQQYSPPSEPVQANATDNRTTNNGTTNNGTTDNRTIFQAPPDEALLDENIVTSEGILPERAEATVNSPGPDLEEDQNAEEDLDANDTPNTSQLEPVEPANEDLDNGELDSQTDSESNGLERDRSVEPEQIEPEQIEPNPTEVEPTVPRLPGEQALPTPGEQTSDRLSPRPAALSIVSFSEADGPQRDVGKIPPRPKEGTMAASIVLDPIAQGCRQVKFSQQQWTYRVAVRANGSVERATVWTGGIAREISGEEGAIACLIESAGFEFEPALFEGEPILDDNLLITINVIEVPQ